MTNTTDDRKQTVLAIDIGGTKMLIAEVDEKGRILGIKRYPTGRLSQRVLTERMLENVKDFEDTVGYAEGRRPSFMGIGAVGRLDPVKGIWKFIADDLPAEEIFLSEIMKEQFGFSCHIDNDVKAAALAERFFGSAGEESDYIYINVGTGLAVGMVVDGHLLRGYENEAGEVWATNFALGEGPCTEDSTTGIGLHRHLEWILESEPEEASRMLGISLPALESLRREMKATELGKAHLSLKGEGRVPGSRILELARKQDPLAVLLTDQLVLHVTLLIRNLVWTLSTRRIILGGGLMSDEWLYERIKAGAEELVGNRLPGGIHQSGLDPAYVGILGAAAVGLQEALS